MLLQLSLDICMCQGILNWQACTLQLWLTGENHILGWLCSCARIMQQMFCSQKKSVHSWELSRLCPWFLQVRFPLEAMSWPWAPQHCWAQLHRGKSCVEHGKREGLLGLFAWVLALSSACAPRTCPSHDPCARQCILTPELLTCQPGSLTYLCALVWLSQLLADCHHTYPAHLLWSGRCPLPSLLRTLTSVLEMLLPGSCGFFNFQCLPSKSPVLILWY